MLSLPWEHGSDPSVHIMFLLLLPAAKKQLLVLLAQMNKVSTWDNGQFPGTKLSMSAVLVLSWCKPSSIPGETVWIPTQEGAGCRLHVTHSQGTHSYSHMGKCMPPVNGKNRGGYREANGSFQAEVGKKQMSRRIRL